MYVLSLKFKENKAVSDGEIFYACMIEQQKYTKLIQLVWAGKENLLKILTYSEPKIYTYMQNNLEKETNITYIVLEQEYI